MNTLDLIGRTIFIVSSCAFVWYQMHKKDKEIEKLKKELSEIRKG